MIYLLKCGNCLLDFKVELKEARGEWVCANCGELQISSIPVDNTGKPLETVGHGSIIGKEAADVPEDPKEIIEGKPLDDSTKPKPEEDPKDPGGDPVDPVDPVITP